MECVYICRLINSVVIAFRRRDHCPLIFTLNYTVTKTTFITLPFAA